MLLGRGKAGARVADLSTTSNPLSHYQQAIDLNLKLMKWRQWPSMLLPEIQSTKCLLLGMGTLGCAVARTLLGKLSFANCCLHLIRIFINFLLGYGIRTMTLVDNGRVSYSNPNRQCLYDYEDCQSRDYKAIIAKKKLLKIVPHCQDTIQSVVLTIPMPGHPYHSSANTASSASSECLVEEAARGKLDELIAAHDVIFLLTDSREARLGSLLTKQMIFLLQFFLCRWLPTLLAKKYNKYLINAALGFDTYLVMHHAYPTTSTTTAADTLTGDEEEDGKQDDGKETAEDGCYFCQDIVAATNSQTNKALDEQCTVTRPGLSAIVAGWCTEMLIAYIHASSTANNSAEGGGKVFKKEDIPHQIRGSVYTFQQLPLHTPAFPYCTACSDNIRNAYDQAPREFVAQVCASASSLEEISGIRKMLESVDVDACIDSDEDF
jgi:ubiquitin-like modifier-activating enzyme ATG7